MKRTSLKLTSLTASGYGRSRGDSGDAEASRLLTPPETREGLRLGGETPPEIAQAIAKAQERGTSDAMGAYMAGETGERPKCPAPLDPERDPIAICLSFCVSNFVTVSDFVPVSKWVPGGKVGRRLGTGLSYGYGRCIRDRLTADNRSGGRWYSSL